MRRIKTKRIKSFIATAIAVMMLALTLVSMDTPTITGNAASLKHIDEIVAESGTFTILEIVPDVFAASFGYYIAGQEPISSADFDTYTDGSVQINGWQATLAKRTSPAKRTEFVNSLFLQLQTKGVLGDIGVTTTPLQNSYYSDNSYYMESYIASDVPGGTQLHLANIESKSMNGTLAPAADGELRAEYIYSPDVSGSGGFVQNISRFEHTAAPAYGQGDYYYSPTFSPLVLDQVTLQEFADNWAKWAKVAIYAHDINTNIYTYTATAEEIVNAGGFDVNALYYYVKETDTGAPGNDPALHTYKAVIDTTDSDDAPQDGFITAPVSDVSYFSRSIMSYTYVGTGGNYTRTSTEGTPYTVNFSDIYYNAGFVNNNLFKQYVFGLTGTNYNAIDVTVRVKKASQVTETDISTAGLIYISAGTDLTRSGVTTGYANDDIPDARAVDLYNYAALQNPVIIDYPIIQGITEATPVNNIQKLCLLILQSTTTTPEQSLSGLNVIWPSPDYVTSDADKTFVNNNIYCFNAFNTVSTAAVPNAGSPGLNDIFAVVSALCNESFTLDVYSSGFSAVLAEIQNENFLKQIAGETTLLPENVTVSSAIRHIINFKGQRQTNPKTSIKVLDIEPAKVTSASPAYLTANTVRGWINNTLPADKITIVHMTTSEFIGKIEDINETYDMIYIGMSTETMNTSSGSTVYNDSAMNGLIYSNIGDIYKASFELAGIRAQDYVYVNGTKAISSGSGSTANQFRFSGNDITKTKVSDLRKYAQAGYPVILADGFVSGSVINTAKVDSSSYMFQAVSGIYGTYQNVMKQSFAASISNADTVIKFLNVSKPSVNITTQPVDYADDINASISVDPNDGYYYLKYVLSISNVTDATPVTTTYDCMVFIDLNADGRYTDNERLDDIEVHRVSDGALVLPLKDGEGLEYYALSADIDYQVTRQMPDSYVGIIPWKLEVIKNGADQIHASGQGYTRIAAAAPKTINVLQIMQPGTLDTKLNLAKQTTEKNPDGSYIGIYGRLINELKDFNVTISVITADVLETKGQTATEILTWLNTSSVNNKGADMLIIGFNDCYDGIKVKSAEAIVSYINSGKSVLFTHDTTSLSQLPTYNFPMAVNGSTPNTKTLYDKNVVWNSITQEYKSIDGVVSVIGPYSTNPPIPGTYSLVGTYDGNAYTISGAKWYHGTAKPFPQKYLYKYYVGSNTIPSNITDWGYFFNTVIRDAVGLDRYGVTSSIPTNAENVMLGSIVNVNASLTSDSIATILDFNRSVAFTPKSGKGSTVNEYQGYTNYALIRFAASGNTYRYTNNTYTNRETTNVSQVNKGQITTYPYNVNTASFGGNDSTITGYGSSYMKIGKTHEQYFQINMNTDDIVVWYCMSSGGTDENSYYDDVPNDSVNAYYIYNKGNVTYSGVGHSSNASLYTGSSIGQEYINEAKLFVNTMIAAYQSTAQAPKITIKKDARGTSDISEKYMLTDNSSVLAVDMSPTDESRAVYYRISDPNVGVGKTITVQYFVSDNDTGIIDPLLDSSQKVSPLGSIETYNTNGSAVTTVKGGYVYKFYLVDKVGSVEVLNQLIDDNVYAFKVYVKVTTIIGSTPMTPAVDSITIKKQQLFELS